MSKLAISKAISVAVGMAMATSCFNIVANIAKYNNMSGILAMFIGFALALALTYSFVLCAKKFPTAFGMRTYIQAGFGSSLSIFIILLYMSLIGMIGILESHLLANLFMQIWPSISPSFIIISVFLISLFLSVKNIELSLLAQLYMVIVMFLILFTVAIFNISTANFSHINYEINFSNFSTAIISSFFLLVGFESVVLVANQSRKIVKSMPRILWISVICIFFIYILINMAFVASNYNGNANAQLFLLKNIPYGEYIALVVSTLAVLTSFNTGISATGRMVYSLSREQLLPKIFMKLNDQAIPYIAIIAATGLILIASLIFKLSDIYLYGNIAAFLIVLCYLCVNLSAIKLKISANKIGKFVQYFTLVVLVLLLVSVAYSLNKDIYKLIFWLFLTLIFFMYMKYYQVLSRKKS